MVVVGPADRFRPLDAWNAVRLDARPARRSAGIHPVRRSDHRAVPAILLALAVSPELALWVTLLYVAVQQFEGNLLTPLVQQYAVDLPGAVLLFSLIGFGTLFGTLGVILAAPLAVVTMVLVKRLYVIETLDTPTPIPGDSKG